MMKIFFILLLIPGHCRPFAPSFLAVKKPSTSARMGRDGGSMDPRKPISAVPSFEEYLKQRCEKAGVGGASYSATTAYAIPGNGYLDTLSSAGGGSSSGGKWKETTAVSSNTVVERAPVDEVVEQHDGEMCVFVFCSF